TTEDQEGTGRTTNPASTTKPLSALNGQWATGSDVVKKQITPAQILDVASSTAAHGTLDSYTFIVGFPGKSRCGALAVESQGYRAGSEVALLGDVHSFIHADTLELLVAADGPFGFLHTAWKPSHYATGLEAHTATRSWRTFRAGGLVTGVGMHAEDRLVIAGIYTDGDCKPNHREHLVRRLTASYGLAKT
ncbi:hypothetical protein ACWD5Q_35505, partial [Streptomyces sp. NPDC002513]